MDNEEQKFPLEELDSAIARLQTKKVEMVREAAWRIGSAARELEDLKPIAGGSFVQSSTRPFNKAEAGNEVAYLCKYQYDFLNKDGDSCGWVRGRPITKKYNDIGPLSGSSGVDYFCIVCGKKIARDKMVMS